MVVWILRDFCTRLQFDSCNIILNTNSVYHDHKMKCEFDYYFEYHHRIKTACTWIEWITINKNNNNNKNTIRLTTGHSMFENFNHFKQLSICNMVTLLSSVSIYQNWIISTLKIMQRITHYTYCALCKMIQSTEPIEPWMAKSVHFIQFEEHINNEWMNHMSINKATAFFFLNCVYTATATESMNTISYPIG